MQVKYETYYMPSLYATSGTLLALNILALMAGSWNALLPIAIQTLVIVSVYACKTWAYVIVKAWSAIIIFSGTVLWLAVLLRGGEFSRSAGSMAFQTLLLLMGVYFFKGAKVILSGRVHMVSPPLDANQEQM